MKKLFLLFLITCTLLSSCTVQRFHVNASETEKNTWRFFGEKTKGKEFKKRYDWFVLGVSLRAADTKKMATELNATSYTVETKENIFTVILSGVTYGILGARVVKVIKR